MPRVLILGIGNLLWADEGFGVRAVEALTRVPGVACAAVQDLEDSAERLAEILEVYR